MERFVLALVLAVAIYFFWTQRLRADLTAILVMLMLVLPWPRLGGEWRGLLEPHEAFSGFGSSAVIMITSMFVIGGALVKTGAVEVLGMRFFRKLAGREPVLQVAVLGATTLTSMFINDTTVVLVFLPLIIAVCREKNLPPSRYLMAAAYGSLLGGQWTLIATRSNLIISDYLQDKSGTGLGFFDFTPVAALIFITCTAYFVLIGRHFLPRTGTSMFAENAPKFLTELVVVEESSACGQRIDEMEWASREDLEVLGILRGKKRIPRSQALEAGDAIVVRGQTTAIGELVKSSDFRVLEESKIDEKTLQSIDLVTVEALISPTSRYAGHTIDGLDIHGVYAFTIMGVERRGFPMFRRPTAAPLQFGDRLLLLGKTSDLDQLRQNPNLNLLTRESFPAIGKRKAAVMGGLLIAIVLLAITKTLSPTISIPVAAFLTIVLGCSRINDAYESIDWQSVVTVAGMIPFGLAMEKTGTAEDLAKFMVESFSGFGPIAVLGALMLLAIVLTQLIENAAVAIILSPMAYQVATALEVNPKTFLVALAICVSGGFCTPFAHESTILVMQPGQYRFKHYLLTGGFMAVATWIIGTLVTPLIWRL